MKLKAPDTMIIALVSVLGAGEALADCKSDLSLALSQTQFNLTLTASQTGELTVQNAGNKACNYFVGFSRGGAADYSRRLSGPSATLSYQLYRGVPYVDVLKDAPEAASNEVLSGAFSSGPTANRHTYAVYRPAVPSSAPPGTYSDTVTVSLYEVRPNNAYALIQSKAVTFLYQANSSVSLSLVDTGAPYDPLDTAQTVSFGQLTTGKSASFDIMLMYNAGYTLLFSSRNGGRLQHTQAASAISYATKVNGVAQDLSASSLTPVRVSTGSGTSPSSGLRIPVTFTVGNVSTQVAGTYRDSITVTVESAQ